MKIEELLKIDSEATPAPWGALPGRGYDEDEGVDLMGAIGPDHRFLLADEWDYDEESKPISLLLEAEAQERANADQLFLTKARSHFSALIAVAQAAQ